MARHQGRSRVKLPPMPMTMYRNFTDAELKSIFTYLQSIPAIRNKVPALTIVAMDDAGDPSVSSQ